MTGPTSDPARAGAASRAELARLARFGRALRRELALDGGLRAFGVVAAAALAGLFVDRWLRLGPTTLAVLRVALAALAVRVTWAWVARPLRERWTAVDLAAALDRGAPLAEPVARLAEPGARLAQPGAPLAQHVATLVQLEPRLAGDAPERGLLAAAVAHARAQLASCDYDARFDRRRARRVRAGWLLALALPAAGALLFPATARLWAARWLAGRPVPWPQRTHLALLDEEGRPVAGALAVARGEPFVVRVQVVDGSLAPDEVHLRARDGDGTETRTVLTAVADGEFRQTLPGFDGDGRLWVAGGDERLGPVPVVVRERPRFDALALRVEQPELGRAEQVDLLTGARELALLPGAQVTLYAQADRALSGARLEVSDGDEAALGVPELSADGRDVTLRWTHARATSLRLVGSAAEGGLSGAAPMVSLSVAIDRPPRVSLAREGVGERVTPQARVPLRAIAQDDVGVEAVVLALARGTAPEPAWQLEVFRARGVEERSPGREVAHEVALAPLGLAVGEVVSLQADAADACAAGAQHGESRALVLRIVEPAHLAAEIGARLQDARAALREAYEDARAVELELASEAGDAGDRLRRHRLLARTTWETRRTLLEGLKEMRLNALLDEASEAALLRRAGEPLEELVERLLPEQRARFEREAPREEQRDGQARIVAALRAALDGLERWDSFVDLVNHLNEVIRLQQEARAATRDSR